MLGTLVVLRNALRNLEKLLPALAAMGKRHAGYGVLPEHYAPVGQALLESMSAIGGEHWKPEYTQARAVAYGAATMRCWRARRPRMPPERGI